MYTKVILVGLLYAGCLAGQPPMMPGEDEYRRIVRGMKASLRSNVALDRREYLPGERICATVTVENSSSHAVMAFAPFHSKESKFTLWALNKSGEWEPTSDWTPRVVSEPTNLMADRRLETFVAGEKRSASICLTENDLVGNPIRHRAAWIFPPGQYKARFDFLQSAEAEFTILPIDEVAAMVARPLPEAELYRKDGGRIRPGCLGMVAAAFRSGERTILVRSMSGMRDTCSRLTTQDALVRTMHPSIRIAESAGAVESFDLTPLADGSVEATWSSAGGPHRERIARPVFPDRRER
ncbi:hypothetical protein [Paludibaculum fermentans]|uniref:Uncharacterized protein n=1 Tax=Paludibaculum fermentans TaxID=1473598 RepID=A0A7S7NPG5_PALFE|nr:hypothetical protein [Paludibaculum fermentans]QOY87371.1 hypothetical protein IRI77_32180 [Paludibaculum fermentans]